MLTLRPIILFSALSLTVSAFAGYDFSYNYSDTRTSVKSFAANMSVGNNGWDGGLTTDSGDADLYLNSVSITPSAGADPNLQFVTPTSSINYYDYVNGAFSTYNFGTAIGGGTGWTLQQFAGVDVFGSSSAAVGTYDFSVQFIGGADSAATDVLQTLDLHVEVVDGIDVSVSGNVNDISGPGDVAHLSMSVKNNMDRDFVTTTWFIGGESYHTDTSDPNSPHLDGSFNYTDDWFNHTIAPGDTRTGAHSDWSLNSSSVVGTYHGRNGLVGGLHNGDFYFYNMDPTPDIRVQSVPEPTSIAALGLGAVAILRRRRKA